MSGSRLGRRGFLWGAGAALMAGLAGSSHSEPILAANRYADPDPQAPSLKERAALKGILFGAAARSMNLKDDPAYAQAFVRECAVLVPEWEAKWGPLRPTPDSFTFDAVDTLQDFAHRHGLGFRGHALVWHEHVPRWLSNIAGDEAYQVLANHIQQVVSRYPAIQSWDVVNEAIEPKDGRADGLRDTVWLRTLGPSYIHDAFVLARQANPTMGLVYNDFDVDYNDRASREKRTAILRLLETLKKQGTPVDTLGIQAHLNPSRNFDARSFRQFLRAAADLGLGLYITELDVIDKELPADIERRDRLAADHAQLYLETALAEPAVEAVFTWGLSDRFAWRKEFSYARRRDGLPPRNLPLDEAMRRKPLWTAIARAFDGATPRGAAAEPKAP